GAMIRISSSSLRSLVVLLALSLAFVLAAPARAQPSDPARGMVLQGTVVTMDDFHSVIEDGSVLVRDDRIVAVWRGKKAPVGTDIGKAVVLDFGPSALIFPGMINLHDHPTYAAVSDDRRAVHELRAHPDGGPRRRQAQCGAADAGAAAHQR